MTKWAVAARNLVVQNPTREQFDSLIAQTHDHEIAEYVEMFMARSTAQQVPALAALSAATQGRIMSLLSPERRREILIAEARPGPCCWPPSRPSSRSSKCSAT